MSLPFIKTVYNLVDSFIFYHKLFMNSKAMFQVFLLALSLQLVFALEDGQLIAFNYDRAVSDVKDCTQDGIITCRAISINFDKLFDTDED